MNSPSIRFRVLERFAQAVAGLEIQGQGDGAELQVNGDPATALVGDQPGHAGCHRGAAHATARPGDRDQLAELVSLGWKAQEVAAERLPGGLNATGLLLKLA